ncbi:MAG: hypothetical protein OES47_14190 [Acidobacteriota bacterium]|nr:hypothetical protein [Acidobacteriota bacterium]
MRITRIVLTLTLILGCAHSGPAEEAAPPDATKEKAQQMKEYVVRLTAGPHRITGTDKEAVPVPPFQWNNHFEVVVTWEEPVEGLSTKLFDFRIITYDAEMVTWTWEEQRPVLVGETGVRIEEVEFLYTGKERASQIIALHEPKGWSPNGTPTLIMFTQTVELTRDGERETLFTLDPPWVPIPFP